MLTGPSDSPYGEYKIGKKTYKQYPLVLAQTTELLNLIASILADQIDKETKKVNLNIASLFDSLVGDALTHFLGIVLIEEGETIEQLAAIRSFAERGKTLAWQVRASYAKEIFADFFVLSKEEIAEVLSLFGMNLADLQSQLSAGLKAISGEISNSLPTAGDVTPVS